MRVEHHSGFAAPLNFHVGPGNGICTIRCAISLRGAVRQGRRRSASRFLLHRYWEARHQELHCRDALIDDACRIPESAIVKAPVIWLETHLKQTFAKDDKAIIEAVERREDQIKAKFVAASANRPCVRASYRASLLTGGEPASDARKYYGASPSVHLQARWTRWSGSTRRLSAAPAPRAWSAINPIWGCIAVITTGGSSLICRCCAKGSV